MEIETLTPELKAQIVDVINSLVDILAVLIIPEAVEENKNHELECNETECHDVDEDAKDYRDEF